MPTKGFFFEDERIFLTLSFRVSNPFVKRRSRLTLPGSTGGTCDSAAQPTPKHWRVFRVCPLPGSTPVNPVCEPRELTERRIRKASYGLALGCTGSSPLLCQGVTPVVFKLLLDAGGCGWRGDGFRDPGLRLRPRNWLLVLLLGASDNLRDLSWPHMGSAEGWGGHAGGHP